VLRMIVMVLVVDFQVSLEDGSCCEDGEEIFLERNLK